MPLITVTQRKGGSGKTTVAICLAGELTRRGHDVGLVDSDPQASSCHWAQPGNLSFPVYQITLADSVPLWAAEVRKITNQCVIIDTSPNERSVASCIALADLILVPCTASGLDLEATSETLNIIRAVRQRRRSAVNVILVPNRIDRRTLEGRQILQELKQFGEAVAPPISVRTSFVRAFSAGISVADLNAGDPANRDIRQLCDMVEQTLPA